MSKSINRPHDCAWINPGFIIRNKRGETIHSFGEDFFTSRHSAEVVFRLLREAYDMGQADALGQTIEILKQPK